MDHTNEHIGIDSAKEPKRSRTSDGQMLLFTVADGIHRVGANDVVQLIAVGAYTHVVLIDGNAIHVAKNLGQLTESLLHFGFYRVHEKHLVNMAHIEHYTRSKNGGSVHLSNGCAAPVSRLRKKEFLAAFRDGATQL
ncbi:MAG: LytTR family transcriptional regulator [Flavobacteriales bacterium]|jgi:two-component system LytT family response regulator|nr:LytTR family transcriptional regulator [Flavobacteriales bacterium]